MRKSGLVQRTHDGLRALRFDAHHDAVRAHEIADGRALPKELGVGDDIECGTGTAVADDAPDLVAGADGHRGFRRDYRIALEMLGDLTRRGMDVGEVGVTVTAPARRADRQHRHIGLGHGLGDIGRKGEPPRLHIAGNQHIEPRLVDGDFSGLERGDLLRLRVHAGHVEPELGETGRGNETHIPGADHRDAHGGAPRRQTGIKTAPAGGARKG